MSIRQNDTHECFAAMQHSKNSTHTSLYMHVKLEVVKKAAVSVNLCYKTTDRFSAKHFLVSRYKRV